MRHPTRAALRGLGLAPTPAVGAPSDTRVALLYLPSTARDRMAVRDRLARAGAVVSIASDMPEALRMLAARSYSLVVVDLAGGEQVVATVRVLRAQSSSIPIIGVMDPADTATAAEALSAGAADLLSWPLEERDILGVLTAARDRSPVDVGISSGMDARLFAHSPAMRPLAEALSGATSRKTGLLIAGAPGTGRCVAAHARHMQDDDYVDRPFVVVDCDASTGVDIERRLFGVDGPQDAREASVEHVGRGGALLSAQGGSLVLKNPASAPARVQARLSHVLRDREVYSVDVDEVMPLDVRVIAIAEPDVERAVTDGRLSRDLFDRLSHTRVDMPRFQQRKEDLPFLAALRLRQICETDRISPKRFSRSALSLIAAMPWKGNGPELTEAISAIVRNTRDAVIQLDDILEHISLDASADPTGETLTLRDARARFEREYISRALIRHHGRVGEAARTLGIQRTNLYRKVRQLRVSKSLLSNNR